MQLIVSAVGQRMPGWVTTAWEEYARRFGRGLALELKEIPMARRARNSNPADLCEAEGKSLLASVPRGFRIVALDERGKAWSTRELATRLETWMQEEHGVSFLVGGPDGLSAECKQSAHETWSLSRLTLPHPLVRVVLAEQLYRAWTVTCNHPYHRA